MPLTATFNNERILAHRTDDKDWVALKRTYKSGDLLLSCGQRAVPVTRKGTKFFAHHPDASTSGHEGHEETPDHLDAKALVAEAAEKLGWKTTIEYAGPNREWVADILVERDGQRIALEIQWSAQSSADFARRQERYKEAGIKCFWFVSERNKSTAHEADVPYAVFFHDSIHHLKMTELFPGDKGFYPYIDEAVEHVLNIGYRRKFQADVDSLTVAYSWRSCEGCKSLAAIFYLADFSVMSTCGRSGRYRRRVTNKWGHISLGHNPVEQAIQGAFNEVLVGEGVAALIQRGHDGKLSFCCRSCGHKVTDADYVLAGNYWETTVPVESPLFQLHPSMLRAPHICRDVGRGRCGQRSLRVLPAVDEALFLGSASFPYD